MSLETDRIEADVNASRHRLNDTLEALGHKLSPGQLLDEALGLFQGQAGQFAGKLGKQVRDNPLPTVLIAGGLAMLLMQNRSDRQPSHEEWAQQRYRALESARWSTARNPDDTDETYEDRVHAAYAKVLDLKQSAGEAAHDFKARVARAATEAKQAAIGAGEKVKQALGSAKHFTQHQAERLGQTASDARQKAGHYYNESPLAIGALALAVGALVGGAAPLSRQERETLGPAVGKAMDKATQVGADMAEKGARAVENSLDRSLH